MTSELIEAVRRELTRPAPVMATALAASLATAFDDPAAVLFYGSSLRTGEREGVHDFYVLTHTPPRGLRGLANRRCGPTSATARSPTSTGRCAPRSPR